MKKVTIILTVISVALLTAVFIVKTQNSVIPFTSKVNVQTNLEKEYPEIEKTLGQLVAYKPKANPGKPQNPLAVHPLPDYLNKSIQWLADAQFSNGGWGAGQNNKQNNRDPKAVDTDPATTAFCGTALLRLGNTLETGNYSSHVKKALGYLLECVEATPGNAANITNRTGTQPQRKLGQNIDVSMAIQFFGKILHTGVSDKKLEKRIDYAMDRCIGMLEETQQADGSWNASGWAPVLNSAMANNALEFSQAIGKNVDTLLNKSQSYQKSNVDISSGRIRTDKSAGVALYSVTSTQRATAKDAMEADEVFKELRKTETNKPIPQTEEEAYQELKTNFSEKKARKLAGSYRANVTAKEQLKNDDLLSGFGNNGGEEYLSYMMTSESFVTESDLEAWNDWHDKMAKLFGKVQNGNGSWTGQHCITSPVFCTAAVVMTLTADRDADILIAKK